MSMPNPRSMHIWNDQNPMRQKTGLHQSIWIFSTTFLKFEPSSTFPPSPSSIYDSPVSYALSPGTWNTFNSFLNLDLEHFLPYLSFSFLLPNHGFCTRNFRVSAPQESHAYDYCPQTRYREWATTDHSNMGALFCPDIEKLHVQILAAIKISTKVF